VALSSDTLLVEALMTDIEELERRYREWKEMPSHTDSERVITRLEAVADAMLTALKRCEQSDIAMGVVYAKSVDREARLRKAIEDAPHQMGCASLQGGPDTEGWGALDNCDCWKRAALEDK
jgi:hypothetical protein